MYANKQRYTIEELDAHAIADLLVDISCTERHTGDEGRSEESKAELRAYVDRCRKAVERYRNGGAHKAILSGKY